MKRAYSPTEVQQMNIPSFHSRGNGRPLSDIPIVQVYGLFGVKAVMEKQLCDAIGKIPLPVVYGSL